jgi:uncharacterized membrane protein YfcA
VPDLAGWAILVAGALLGSLVAGVAGFGAGMLLLPLIAWTLGLRATAPVLTVTMFLGNLSRIWWSRGDIDGPVARRFLLGAIPATALGAMFYAGTSTEWLSRIIGLFLIAAVPLRRMLAAHWIRVRLGHFPVVGGAIGLLSALVVITGPVLSPFFLAYGLRRTRYIATEAVCALAMHLTRAAAFSRYALITWDTVVVGATLGSIMFFGSWLARRALERMSERLFLALIEGLLVIMGLQFLLVPR